MKHVAPQQLQAATQTALNTQHALVTAEPDYGSKVALAKDRWNRAPKTLVSGLKLSLERMCGLGKRCIYCEDSIAQHIEHRRPKALYPDETFSWPNLLYACLDCNSTHKRSTFAVLQVGADGHISTTDVTRKKGAPIVPPIAGVDAFIDPLVEDPLDFLQLDFNTFMFAPLSANDNSPEYHKAVYTTHTLGLNRRKTLVDGRRVAYRGFLARIRDFATERGHLAPAEIAERKNSLLSERHLTVWEEMKRQQNQYANLANAFAAAPEVATW